MMQPNDEDKAIQNKFKDLNIAVKQCEDERIKSQQGLSNIAKAYQRVQKAQKITPHYKTKLKGLYSTAIQDAESEVNVLKNALETIQCIRTMDSNKRIRSRHAVPPRAPMSNGALMMMLHIQGESLPVWFGKRNHERPPPLCGAIPPKSNYIAKVNDMVAANVKQNNEDVWIMARVIKYFPSTRKYDIEDVDEGQTERHTINRRKVIPLPLHQANPETNPEAIFPADTLVLAAYPQLTCFYPAIVKYPPSKLHDNYIVLFKDPEFRNGINLKEFKVCQKYVLRFRERGRK